MKYFKLKHNYNQMKENINIQNPNLKTKMNINPFDDDHQKQIDGEIET